MVVCSCIPFMSPLIRYVTPQPVKDLFGSLWKSIVSTFLPSFVPLKDSPIGPRSPKKAEVEAKAVAVEEVSPGLDPLDRAERGRLRPEI